MTHQNTRRLRTVLRIGLGVLLIWAAISKIARPVDFQASIYAYEMPLPRSFLKVVAVALPWAELLSGLMLLVNFSTEGALVFVTFIFALFVVATGIAWMRRLPISCGCFDINVFGIGQKYPGLVTFLESVGFAFFRNLFLTAAALFLLKRRFEELRGESISAAEVPAPAKKAAAISWPEQTLAGAQKLTRKQRKRAAASAR